MPPVAIRQQPTFHVASVRHVGPYMECTKAWDKLMSVLVPQGRVTKDSIRIGIGYDNPSVVPAAELRYDACVTVGADFEAGHGVTVQDIPGGEYAVYTHRGPYDELVDAYGALLGQWLPGSGRQPANAPCYEIYVTPPDTPPADLVTEICLPLQPKA